jgi:hypothetical protein
MGGEYVSRLQGRRWRVWVLIRIREAYAAKACGKVIYSAIYLRRREPQLVAFGGAFQSQEF